MEDTKRKIEVMQAYEDGKDIQVRYLDGNEGKWEKCNCPVWHWGECDYRVKPEAKYRPYKDYHEMVEDFCERFGVKYSAYEMPYIWVKQKDTDYVHLISSFQGNKDEVRMENYFQNNTYLDGSPVGKKVEE